MTNRVDYSTTGSSRLEFPKIETVFGTLAYWLSLRFGDYGWTFLGGFEPPYTGEPGNKTIVINNVAYEGSIGVYLSRSGALDLDYSSLHRVSNWRDSITASARQKLDTLLMPLARELFPMPTTENYAQYAYETASREAYSGASSAIHKHRVDVYRDKRYAGFSDDIRAGMAAGLQRATDSLAKENFDVDTRY